MKTANGVALQVLSSFESSPGSAVRLLEEAERPDYAGVTRDGAAGTVTAVGRAAGPQTLSQLVLLLAGAGVPVLDGSAGEGCVSVKVAQAQLLPALELVHGALIG